VSFKKCPKDSRCTEHKPIQNKQIVGFEEGSESTKLVDCRLVTNKVMTSFRDKYTRIFRKIKLNSKLYNFIYQGFKNRL
jgi:hypothetical protein